MKKIAIIGAGGNGRELAELLRALPQFQVLGFLTNTNGRYNSPVLGGFDWPACHDVDAFAMGIGDPIAKFRVAQELVARYPHIEWPVIVHPSAYLGSSVVLGRGVVDFDRELLGGSGGRPPGRVGHRSGARRVELGWGSEPGGGALHLGGSHGGNAAVLQPPFK